ncbi:SGNH/GDSL hydrolase family protein [bacterium]|nr:SGNH/GDSL hydrolase family protein [bacterium]
MGRGWREIGVSFQAVSHLRFDCGEYQSRKFEKCRHRGEYPMRFASSLMLLLIPAFTLAQTRDCSHGVDALAVPFAMVSEYSKSVQEIVNESQLVEYSGARHDFLNHGRDEVLGKVCVEISGRLNRSEQQHRYIDTLQEEAERSPNVHLRNHFDNSWDAFARKKKGTVAFIGGSITEMSGYRVMVEQNLRRRFPDTDFKFVNAGISSTCSTTGAHRLARDVLSTEPDLLFVEFAVNDDQDASHAERECRRGMEGVLRHARANDPAMDVVVTHFVNPPMLELLRQGKTPVSSGAHESVADHYGVSTIDLAREVAERIETNELTWVTYGGTHPKPAGNRIAADLIEQLLDAAWADEEQLGQGKPSPHKLASVLDPASYSQGGLLAGTKADFDKSWVLGVPAWDSIPGGKRGRFIELDMLCTNAANAELTLDFDGQAVGVYVLAGPDAGRVEYSIDGGEFKTAELFHRFSKGLHYPRTVMLATGLKRGPHRLTMRVAKNSHQQSNGNAVRILEFVTN